MQEKRFKAHASGTAVKFHCIYSAEGMEMGMSGKRRGKSNELRQSYVYIAPGVVVRAALISTLREFGVFQGIFLMSVELLVWLFNACDIRNVVIIFEFSNSNNGNG